MGALGRALVYSEAPQRADAALVLAGDYYGYRILKAAEMVREGFVPRVLVSGPEAIYGVYESDLAIAFAVKRGLPAEWFVPLRHAALSTDEEARLVVPGIRKMGVRRLLVVTSDYHTARSRRVFRDVAPDLEVHMIAAPDRYYRPDAWWSNRQSRKTFLMEWIKTVAYGMGL